MILPEIIQTKTDKWTYQDYDLLPPEFRCQILKGELTMSPSPTIKHQYTSRELEVLFHLFVTKHHLGEIFDAPMDVVLDEENVPQPDLIFIAEKNKQKITEKNIQGAPDIVVEILSPSSIKQDRVEKMELYARFDVPEYWIVDTANHSVEVYELKVPISSGLKEKKYNLFSFAAEKGIVQSMVLSGFEVEIESIFKK